MNDARAAADALFKGPVERIVRKTRRTGSIHDRQGRAVDLPAIAKELRRLESLAARLTVWRNDPERFHVDKDALKSALGTLAKQLEGR